LAAQKERVKSDSRDTLSGLESVPENVWLERATTAVQLQAFVDYSSTDLHAIRAFRKRAMRSFRRFRGRGVCRNLLRRRAPCLFGILPSFSGGFLLLFRVTVVRLGQINLLKSIKIN
jgi:hypothetical protein